MGLPFVYTIWELRGTMKEIGLDNEEFEEDSSKKRMDELKRNFDISANAPDTIKEAWRLASQIQEAKKQNLDNFSDTFQKTEVEQDKVE